MISIKICVEECKMLHKSRGSEEHMLYVDKEKYTYACHNFRIYACRTFGMWNVNSNEFFP